MRPPPNSTNMLTHAMVVSLSIVVALAAPAVQDVKVPLARSHVEVRKDNDETVNPQRIFRQLEHTLWKYHKHVKFPFSIPLVKRVSGYAYARAFSWLYWALILSLLESSAKSS